MSVTHEQVRTHTIVISDQKITGLVMYNALSKVPSGWQLTSSELIQVFGGEPKMIMVFTDETTQGSVE